MSVLFIFIFISILVVSALLFFNKGEKSLEIKSILKDILENLKDLFSNLKKLFLIIKELIQSKLDQEPIQLEDGNKTAETPNSTSPNESKSELEIPSEDSINESSASQPQVNSDPVVVSDNPSETMSKDSINESSAAQPQVNSNPVVVSDSELETPSRNLNNDKDDLDKNN